MRTVSLRPATGRSKTRSLSMRVNWCNCRLAAPVHVAVLCVRRRRHFGKERLRSASSPAQRREKAHPSAGSERGRWMHRGQVVHNNGRIDFRLDRLLLLAGRELSPSWLSILQPPRCQSASTLYKECSVIVARSSPRTHTPDTLAAKQAPARWRTVPNDHALCPNHFAFHGCLPEERWICARPSSAAGASDTPQWSKPHGAGSARTN